MASRLILYINPCANIFRVSCCSCLSCSWKTYIYIVVQPMKRELVFCPWATISFVLLVCESCTLSMALCVHQGLFLRSSSCALRFRATRLKQPHSVTSSDPARANTPQRKRPRRGRASSLHSDAYGRPNPPASHVQSSVLLTAMDKVLPFGRCVGVALPSALTNDALRAAKQELMPEEVSYCLGLPATMQVGVRHRQGD